MDISLSVLSSLILSKYFLNSQCLFIITDNSNNFNYHGEMGLVNIKISNNTLNDYAFRRRFGCLGFVIHSDTPCELFKNIEKMMSNSAERFNERKYLILPGNNYQKANTMCMFKLDEIKYVANVLLIIPTNDNTSAFQNEFIKRPQKQTIFDLITHKFVGKIYNKTVFLDQWFSSNRSFLYNNNLYPDKISDQEERTLRVITMTYPPYTVPDALDGTELRMTQLYAKLHNMSIEVLVDDVYLWGEIFEDWTGNGIIGYLAMNTADVGFASLYLWEHESFYLDFSRVYIRAGMTCMVPAPILAAGWLTPVLAFSSKLWIAVGITFILLISALFIVLLLVKKFKLNNRYFNMNRKTIFCESCFNTISIFVVQSVPTSVMPNNGLFKLVFGMGLLFALLLSSTYSSGLYGNMTVPKFVGEIRTIRDLIDSKITWFGTHILFIEAIRFDNHPDYVKLVSKFDVLNSEELHEHLTTNKYGVVIERLPFGHYSIGDYIGEQEMTHMKPMKEDLYYSYTVFMAKKSSVIIPSLNKLIAKIVESGISEYWENSVVMNTMNTKVQNAIINSVRQKGVDEGDATPSKLKFKHLSGAFALCGFGLLLSVMIFLLEYIMKLIAF